VLRAVAYSIAESDSIGPFELTFGFEGEGEVQEGLDGEEVRDGVGEVFELRVLHERVLELELLADELDELGFGVGDRMSLGL